jgi:hypothetical protein
MSTVGPPIPSKPNFMSLMLANYPMVDVHFRIQPAVLLPSFAAQGPIQMFQYGLNLPKPIPDLTIGSTGILATLSFGGAPHLTFVPWDAIFAIFASGSMEVGHVWHDDQPALVSPSKLTEAFVACGKVANRNHLRLVPLDGPQEPLTEPRLTIHDLRVIQGDLK